MTTAKERQPYTIQLTPGKDDDLIELIKALPTGYRNDGLKSALRAGFRLAGPTVAHNGETTALRAELAGVRQALEDMPGWLDTRFSAVHQAISQATIGPGEQPAEPTIEALPRLSADAKERRAAKLEKAKW